ncbi:MAG: hypothetical protein J6M37_04360 [Prevotella sp.]|nr:hypothetical protein [Prevotella sp.]
MKRIITFVCIFITATAVMAQKPFCGKFNNEEYKVFLKINFTEKDIIVPNQEVFGELDGYIGSTQCNTVWPITSSDIKGKNAFIEVINNYGSEDFEATLKILNDSTIQYEHNNGSTLKFPVNKKWHKIPNKLIFKRMP